MCAYSMPAQTAAFQPPDPHIPIRSVQLTDVEPLWNVCWRDTTFQAVYQRLKQILHIMDQRRGLGIVVTDAHNTALAYGQIVRWPTAAELSDLVVAEAERGRGIGTAMIQYLVAAAYDLQVARIEIGVALSNARALGLYRRLGFTDSHTLMLNLTGGKEPVLFLALDIAPLNPGHRPGV
jgi:ribosomal protein S18 acetylase RimI-like enzyme